jgi:hypothetical protein
MSQCFDHNLLLRSLIVMKFVALEKLKKNATNMSDIAFP